MRLHRASCTLIADTLLGELIEMKHASFARTMGILIVALGSPALMPVAGAQPASQEKAASLTAKASGGVAQVDAELQAIEDKCNRELL